MSSVFQKPLSDSRNIFLLILVSVLLFLLSHVSGFDFDFPHYENELSLNPEPDYDELLVRLSLYAFNRLSPRDQLEQVEEIRHNVKSEDVELQGAEKNDEAFRQRKFAELFKKLPYSDQLKHFLSKVIQKFKRERKFGELIASFKHLEAKHQQQLIEQIVPITPENIQDPEETEEDFRLRRFTQLSRDYTDYVYRSTLGSWKETEKSQNETEKKYYDENNSDWRSSFADFFLGFSIIWFQGQSARGQDLLIEQLPHQVGGVIIKSRPPGRSVQDFKLRRFTEFCKNVVDFEFQDKFLNQAEYKLERWGVYSDARLIVEPQDSDTDAELLSRLSTFGFSLLSSKYQQQKIDEMSDQVDGVVIERCSAAEDTRIRRFTELFNQLPVSNRLDLFKEFKGLFSREKDYAYWTRFFKQLGSKDQAEMIDKMFYAITENSWSPGDATKLIIEKFPGESEECFRLRRFQKIHIEHPSKASYYVQLKAKRRVKEGTALQLPEESEDESHYAEFLFGVSIIWFKSRCASYHRRNPIQLILFGEVEFSDIIEKLPEESDEDFRLRRFTESFKQLQFTFRERIVHYIQRTIFHHPVVHTWVPCSYQPYEGREAFDPEFFKVKHPNLKGQGASTTTRGAGGGQGTCQIVR